jgi:hypothetical protein
VWLVPANVLDRGDRQDEVKRLGTFHLDNVDVFDARRSFVLVHHSMGDWLIVGHHIADFEPVSICWEAGKELLSNGDFECSFTQPGSVVGVPEKIHLLALVFEAWVLAPRLCESVSAVLGGPPAQVGCESSDSILIHVTT